MALPAQPARTQRKLSIDEQRIAIDAHLADNPSLKTVVAEATALAYRQARIGAQRETDLDAAVFPAQRPWTFAAGTRPRVSRREGRASTFQSSAVTVQDLASIGPAEITTEDHL
jgi:hypothetical protein